MADGSDFDVLFQQSMGQTNQIDLAAAQRLFQETQQPPEDWYNLDKYVSASQTMRFEDGSSLSSLTMPENRTLINATEGGEQACADKLAVGEKNFSGLFECMLDNHGPLTEDIWDIQYQDARIHERETFLVIAGFQLRTNSSSKGFLRELEDGITIRNSEDSSLGNVYRIEQRMPDETTRRVTFRSDYEGGDNARPPVTLHSLQLVDQKGETQFHIEPELEIPR